MRGSPQYILNQLDPDLRQRTIMNLQRRLGIHDFHKLSKEESDFVKREIEIYLWIEGEDSYGCGYAKPAMP